MAEPGLIGGILRVTVNGKALAVKPGWEWSRGGFDRETVLGATEPHGHKSTPRVPFVAGPMTWDGTDDIDDLQEVTGATVVAEFANGRTLVIRDAHAAGPWTGSTDEGEVQARYEGKIADII